MSIMKDLAGIAVLTTFGALFGGLFFWQVMGGV